VASTDAGALVSALGEERIVTSSRDSNLRVSLHLYNVDEDVGRLLEGIAKNRHLLA
jgi:selenocysteine lyase/cysteine desulfurase